MAQFDYVSDLHIDYWDPEWRTLYMNNGPISDFPLDWGKMNRKSSILVVAGDVCDKLEFTIDYLKGLRKYYNEILFVDGNHEHVYQKPKLYTRDFIGSKFEGVENIHYLPKKDVIAEKTVFIGVCGWWDYNCRKNMQECEDFAHENSHKEKVKMAKNIVLRAQEEAEKLLKKIDHYQKSDMVDDIVIVTHTIPLKKFAREVETDYNNFFELLNLPERAHKGSKIKRWVFGHVHDEHSVEKYGIKMLSHPRGRPGDHNREKFDLKTSYL